MNPNPAHLDSKIDTGTIANVKNVYIHLDGTLRALPFNGDDGLWFFDGQIFYKKHKSN